MTEKCQKINNGGCLETAITPLPSTSVFSVSSCSTKRTRTMKHQPRLQTNITHTSDRPFNPAERRPALLPAEHCELLEPITRPVALLRTNSRLFAVIRALKNKTPRSASRAAARRIVSASRSRQALSTSTPSRAASSCTCAVGLLLQRFRMTCWKTLLTPVFSGG